MTSTSGWVYNHTAGKYGPPTGGGGQQGPANIGPGTPYGFGGRGGWTWYGGANETWARDHSINPLTGDIEGPFPLPPADLARGYQAMHDRAVWQARQRWMQGGIDYAKGALGLLQSYRPGGSAALEANVYQGVAGLMFNRAAMTQPIDLLGDLRRHEGAIAQQAANRARERQMGVQIGTAVATIAASALGAGAIGGLAAGALGGIASGIMNREAGNSAYGASLSQQYQPGGGSGFIDDANPVTGSQQIQQPQLPSPTEGGEIMPGGQQLASVLDTGSGQQESPNAMQRQPQPGQAPGQAGAGVAGSGAQQRTMGAGLAGGGVPMPGADGNFTNVAYASNGAMQAGSVGNPMERVVMTNVAADVYESDPFFRSLPVAINGLWRRTLELV